MIQISRTQSQPVSVLLLTASDQYDPKYYGNASLRFCVSDAKKFLNDSPLTGDIQVIEIYNQDMTKAAVMAAIADILPQLQAGDLFTYYTSSHGTYYDFQENGKDVRMTGRCMYAPGAGNGDPVLWDRELIRLWKMIPEGVTVLTISDSCFSESQDRQTAAPNFEYQAKRFVELRSKANTVVPTNGKLTLKKGAGIVSISACRVDQTSLEVMYKKEDRRNGGVFTEAFVGPAEVSIINQFLAAKRAIPARMTQVPTISFSPKSGATFNRIKKLRL